jgi:hypothetical protein
MSEHPIHTLEAARQSLMILKHNVRAASTGEQRKTFQDALDKLYTRWPDLRGGIDEVVIRGR